jgi:2-haloalkanoic acid dehalogenase type II
MSGSDRFSRFVSRAVTPAPTRFVDGVSMSSPEPHHPSAQRIDRVLAGFGLAARVRELPGSTRTAVDAARTLGCEVRQIVKSLVFRVGGSETAVLALVAGDHKLDERWMENVTGHAWVRSDPEFARAATGYGIGGVPPVGHPTGLPTYIDYDLLEQSEVWAAAGHPHAVCRLSPSELLRITGGTPVSVVPLSPRTPPGGPWISFDCFGTLIDWRQGLSEAVARALGTDGATADEKIFPAYLEAERCIEAGPYRPYRSIMVGALTSAMGSVGVQLDGDPLVHVPESIPRWPIFPDTRNALDRLRSAGYRIAVLSNIDRDLLESTLDHHGLSVDLSVTAEETRSYKPALGHWIRFLKETGAVPGNIWHVAGGYDYDIPPAASLGFRTIYVSRYGPAPEAFHGIQVTDLASLGPTLEGQLARDLPSSG